MAQQERSETVSTTTLAIICFALGCVILGVAVVQSVRAFRQLRYATTLREHAAESQHAE